MKVELAEGLVVGPHDTLIIRLNESAVPDDWEFFINDMQESLKGLGLWERTLILQGDIELAKVEGDSNERRDD